MSRVNPVLLGVSAAVTAHRQRIPLVASYHAHLSTYAHLYRLGWIEPLDWRYLRTVHHQAQVNLCTSRATGEELVRRGFARVELWPYGVDTQRFDPAHACGESRARLSANRPERVVLLYVGRLAKEKTVERLLEAVQVDGVALAIVGDGPLRPRLEPVRRHPHPIPRLSGGRAPGARVRIRGSVRAAFRHRDARRGDA